jgi:hypothetical protein
MVPVAEGPFRPLTVDLIETSGISSAMEKEFINRAEAIQQQITLLRDSL